MEWEVPDEVGVGGRRGAFRPIHPPNPPQVSQVPRRVPPLENPVEDHVPRTRTHHRRAPSLEFFDEVRDYGGEETANPGGGFSMVLESGRALYANAMGTERPHEQTGYASVIGDGRGFPIGQQTTSFADEPPLLEELGIDFSHVISKIVVILNPFGRLSDTLLRDQDLAGPLVFCLLLGFILLFTGKVHFGYIYGIGSICVYFLMNFMASATVDIARVGSILGYALLPIILISPISVFYSFRNIFGFLIGFFAVLYCSSRATSFFVAALEMRDQKWLVAYPLFLVYATFSMIALL